MRTSANRKNLTESDWRKIRQLFEAGGSSTRCIAKTFGVSDTEIRKNAKKENWVKPNGSHYGREPAKPESANLPAAQPEPPAESHVDWAAKAEPEELAKRGRLIILSLMAELEYAGMHISEIENAIEEECADDTSPRQRNLMLKAISLPVRTKAAQNLASALRGLAEAEPGKKAQRQNKAKAAGTNKFATPQAPHLAVDNTQR